MIFFCLREYVWISRRLFPSRRNSCHINAYSADNMVCWWVAISIHGGNFTRSLRKISSEQMSSKVFNFYGKGSQAQDAIPTPTVWFFFILMRFTCYVWNNFPLLSSQKKFLIDGFVFKNINRDSDITAKGGTTCLKHAISYYKRAFAKINNPRSRRMYVPCGVAFSATVRVILISTKDTNSHRYRNTTNIFHTKKGYVLKVFPFIVITNFCSVWI